MQFDQDTLEILPQLLNQLEQGFSDLPDVNSLMDFDQIVKVLESVATRMQDNYPYHHPLYAGQMLKPPHTVARLAYMLTLWLNPNNHALDGGRASSQMEKEAVAELASMFGWQRFLGHLCGGGTMANMEALWIAGKLHPGKSIIASEMAHYTHQRISEVLKLPFVQMNCDRAARMDVSDLEELLKTNDVGTVVVNMGSTATGSVDPLDDILNLQSKYKFRIHADAAYGGYFCLVDNLPATTKTNFNLLNKVDSIVIDPHKHGLQPYGCGCILFANPDIGTYYKHESPYTYFTSEDLHLGEISLECSRAGASAVALWATQKQFPLTKEGEFAQNLHKTRQAALALYKKISLDSRFLTVMPPELDIVIWAPKAESLTKISQMTQQIFNRCAQQNLHLAVASYPAHLLPELWAGIDKDADSVACLRSVLMKPEHLEWIEKIWEIIHDVTNEVVDSNKVTK